LGLGSFCIIAPAGSGREIAGAVRTAAGVRFRDQVRFAFFVFRRDGVAGGRAGWRRSTGLDYVPHLEIGSLGKKRYGMRTQGSVVPRSQ